jgi:hypothetical protein
MSNVKLQESDGTLHLMLPKNDPKWETINDKVKTETKGEWVSAQNRWEIPKVDLNKVRAILNETIDDDDSNDKDSDTSGDEGYTTDASVASSVPRTQSRINMAARLKSLSSPKVSRAQSVLSAIIDRKPSHKVDDDEDEDALRLQTAQTEDEISRIKNDDKPKSRSHHHDDEDDDDHCNDANRTPISRRPESDRREHRTLKPSTPIPQHGHDDDDDELDHVFDSITDDARMVKLKKILKIIPFQYFLKNNVSRSEFRYLMKVGGS